MKFESEDVEQMSDEKPNLNRPNKGVIDGRSSPF